MTSRKRVIFVAGLTPMAKGHGGQLTAATTLFQSRLGDEFELVPLSSTMASIPPPPLRARLAAAARRLLRFAAELPNVDAALIFSADGLALIEKGLMCALARGAGRGVVLRISSGSLPAQCQCHPMLAHWLRWTLSSTHAVCSQGHFWTAFFDEFPEAAGKISEVGNGIELRPRPANVTAGEGQRVVFVGATARNKGIFELLEAFRRVRAEHPRATLTYLGGGADLEALRAASASAGLEACVSIRGWVPKDRVAPALAEHDVFVLPSHWEGLPNALLEAMAASLPVISTRVGGIPDVVAPGENGLLITPGDVDALAAALGELLGAPERARAMGRRARKTIEDRYDIERVWTRYADLLARSLRETGHEAPYA